MGSNLPKIAAGIAGGNIKTLIVFGEDVTKYGIGENLLAKLDMLIVSDILPNKTTRAGALSCCPDAPTRRSAAASSTSRAGCRRFMQNIQPKGNARPEWEFLHELVLQRHRRRTALSSIEGLFNQMAREVPAFNGLTWAGLGDLGVTVPI